MKTLLIGFSTTSQNYQNNLHQALKTIFNDDATIDYMPYCNELLTPLKIANKTIDTCQNYDNIIIVIEDDVLPHHFNQLTIISAYLKKPYYVIFENLENHQNQDKKNIINNLCNRAQKVFVLQQKVDDVLTHHYQVDTDKIVPLKYGYWPSSVTTHPDAKNSIAVVVNHATLANLESVIKAIPRLRKINSNLKTHLYITDDSSLGSHLTVRNRILINKLSLRNHIEWHLASNNSLTHLAHRHSMVIFSWSDTNAGNRTLRYEIMASGGVVVSYKDNFAEEQLTDDRAFIINNGSTINLPDTLEHLYSSQLTLNRIKDTARFAGENNTWEKSAAKIVQIIRKNHTTATATQYPQYDILQLQEYTADIDKNISKRIKGRKDNFSAEALMLLNRTLREEFKASSDEMVRHISLIEQKVDRKTAEHKPLFLVAHSLFQISENESHRLNKTISKLFEEMAPYVQNDYHLIELHYHMLRYRQVKTPHQLQRIIERATYMAELAEVNIKDEELKANHNIIKSVLTIIEASFISGDSKLLNRATHLLSLIDKDLFTNSGFKVGTSIPTSELIEFVYFMVICHRHLFIATNNSKHIEKLDYIWNWLYGFNDKNRVYYNSDTGNCNAYGDQQYSATEEVLIDTLLFWLMENNMERAMLHSYHTSINASEIK